MSSFYRLRKKIEQSLKKIPFIYTIGHKIRLNKEERKANELRTAFKKHGIDTMRDVQHVLEQTNWPFFFTCGSLLGIIRENGLIEHDLDLDVAIMENEDFTWDKLKELMEAAGFQLSRGFFIDDILYEVTYTREGLGVDIYIEEIVDEHTMTAPFFYRRTSEQYAERWEHSVAYMDDVLVENIITKRVYDFDVNIPENYEDILYGNYGESWQTPIKNNDIWLAPNLRLTPEIRGMRINY
jgi:hypothetical protein